MMFDNLISAPTFDGTEDKDIFVPNQNRIINERRIENKCYSCMLIQRPVFIDSAFNDVIFKRCRFDDCTIAGTVFNNCEFYDCRFVRSTISETFFSQCSFNNTDFTRTVVAHSGFENLSFANMHVDSESSFYETYFDPISDNEDNIRKYFLSTCPAEGSFIGWKKAYDVDNNRQVLVKLKIEDDAKRSSAFGKKCRCSKARVMGIFTLDGKQLQDVKVRSFYDKAFMYEVGKTVTPVAEFDDNWSDECSSGIHFFISKEDAINY